MQIHLHFAFFTTPSPSFAVRRLLLCLCLLALAAWPTLAAPAARADGVAPGAWSMIVLPDTQFYTLSDAALAPFHSQTQWIADNKDAYNIQMVVHLGDIVENNAQHPVQWTRAHSAMSTLNGVVPYAMATGNHDYGPTGNAGNRGTLFNDYFKESDNPLNDRAQGGTIGGVYESGSLENVYHTFRANDVDYLVLSLEWGPRNGAVAWANGVVAAHPDHRAILITHAYLYTDGVTGARYDWDTYGGGQLWNPRRDNPPYGTGGDTNDGQQLWDKLVNEHPNFVLTMNGHVLNGGVGFLTSENGFGHDVHQMLFNAQEQSNGGNGWLRILEFDPDNETIRVRTYSPFLDAWGEEAWPVAGAADQFEMKMSFIPEPSSLALLGMLGLCGLSGLRRRKPA